MYCEKCQKIEYGTEPVIYALAENLRSEQLNIAKVGDIIGWALSELRLIDGDGFKENLICNDSLQIMEIKERE